MGSVLVLSEDSQLKMFENLENFYMDALMRLSKSLVNMAGGSWEDAEEIYADSRIKALKAFANLDPVENFFYWRRKILVNVWKAMRPKHNISIVSFETFHSDFGDDIVDEYLDVENEILDKQENDVFWKKVASILERNSTHYQCIRLRYLEGLSQSEMAKVLDCPVGTVKSRLYYAHELIRKSIALQE